jgi:hypothetical protein
MLWECGDIVWILRFILPLYYLFHCSSQIYLTMERQVIRKLSACVPLMLVFHRTQRTAIHWHFDYIFGTPSPWKQTGQYSFEGIKINNSVPYLWSSVNKTATVFMFLQVDDLPNLRNRTSFREINRSHSVKMRYPNVWKHITFKAFSFQISYYICPIYVTTILTD